ncbi:MAG TPA: class I SAM-dependent methyltransferase [Nitrolancea sp.]|nr:class I SAM-dependent methyltransferase [Nitrolancea sp.]
MEVATRPIDQEKLTAFLEQMVQELAVVISSGLVVVGDRLGLYRAMADGRPVSDAELAATTGVDLHYLHDWLVNQAAGGYVEYDAATDRYRLTPEQALILAGLDGPLDAPGGFISMTALVQAADRIAGVMRTGGGMSWGEHHHGLFEGTERFFKGAYRTSLVQQWIPALDGVAAKLRAGARVADVGCGHAASTIIMAQAYPNSRFVGFDAHAPSIEHARQAAEEAGVADRVTFAVADAASYPGQDYDLIAYFDCFHDLPAPYRSAQHSYQALAPDGTVMLVEPMAGNTVAENLNPVGRFASAASVLVCRPNALATSDVALGTIAPDAAIEGMVRRAGFSHFRRATETPFNRVFEARR